MDKLTIIATIDVAPGTRDDVVAAMLAHRQRSLHDEPGTLQFDVLVPDKAADRIMLYEVYQDRDAFKEHVAGESMKRVMAEVEGKVLKMTGVRYATPSAG